jgi:hypothetical protein
MIEETIRMVQLHQAAIAAEARAWRNGIRGWAVEQELRREIDRLTRERDEAVVEMDRLLACAVKAERERDEARAAATARHANPADWRYWEGRYRDEAAEVERLREALRKISISVDAEKAREIATAALATKEPGR